jgi:hypothetical protein
MKKFGGVSLSKPPGLKSAGAIQAPKPKVHPASVQKTRMRLPQGPSLDNDPSPILPNVGKI